VTDHRHWAVRTLQDGTRRRTEDRESAARRMLVEAIAGLAECYPEVKLVEQLGHGHPLDVLVLPSLESREITGRRPAER
jgi:hypothetical protein